MQGPSVRIGLPETGTVRDARSRPVLSWENSVAEPRNKATPGITGPRGRSLGDWYSQI
jgi:hypothetical protein